MNKTWSNVADEDDMIIHIMPNNDMEEHILNNCSCNPTPEDYKGWKLWKHHSFDRREEYQNSKN